MDLADQAWHDYQKDFTKRKNEILMKITCLEGENQISKNTKNKWLHQIFEFIKEQKG